MLIRAVAPATVPADRDLELWTLPPGATQPRSLGVLPVTETIVTKQAAPAIGTQLLISLEPRGGSPTGLPTGPVLYSGKVVSL
jgi:anti-sigma-K factor RskA